MFLIKLVRATTTLVTRHLLQNTEPKLNSIWKYVHRVVVIQNCVNIRGNFYGVEKRRQRSVVQSRQDENKLKSFSISGTLID